MAQCTMHSGSGGKRTDEWFLAPDGAEWGTSLSVVNNRTRMREGCCEMPQKGLTQSIHNQMVNQPHTLKMLKVFLFCLGSKVTPVPKLMNKNK